MSKSLRLSEKWFRWGLWLIAFIFASFLIGLGGTIVGDLPQVAQHKTLDDFLDTKKTQPIKQSIEQLEEKQKTAQRALEQVEIQLNAAKQSNDNAREAFSNWLATRQVTQLVEQDQELIKRTKELDGFSSQLDKIQKQFQLHQKEVLDAQQEQEVLTTQLSQLEQEALILLNAEERKIQLQVFIYRLLLTLPLLLFAGWLFIKKRKGTYWPFVWGFTFFALFTFFVELVPYLPSYGGYVRYIVGILLTVVVGRYAIRALNHYLIKQQAIEKLSDQDKRQELSYDLALTRFAKGVCPSCERGVDVKNTAVDFCPHCGISLFDHCIQCGSRKNTFSKFCYSCGTSSRTLKEHT
ncbi:serine endopeptidase [Neisseria sp. Ec49-e6-T10]|uniref:serine endopeptidase n=1 Tax=Neisseria sp. Ec49-e6-T10 TaxID=3140744 RepID=UPI003EBE2E70